MHTCLYYMKINMYEYVCMYVCVYICMSVFLYSCFCIEVNMRTCKYVYTGELGCPFQGSARTSQMKDHLSLNFEFYDLMWQHHSSKNVSDRSQWNVPNGERLTSLTRTRLSDAPIYCPEAMDSFGERIDGTLYAKICDSHGDPTRVGFWPGKKREYHETALFSAVPF